MVPDSATQDAVHKRTFSKVSNTKSKFANEKSSKRFAGNIDKSDKDIEEKDNTILKHLDGSSSCENAGSSNSSNEIEVVEKACSIKETEEGMYSYVSDDDLEEDNQNIISVS